MFDFYIKIRKYRTIKFNIFIISKFVTLFLNFAFCGGGMISAGSGNAICLHGHIDQFYIVSVLHISNAYIL